MFFYVQLFGKRLLFWRICVSFWVKSNEDFKSLHSSIEIFRSNSEKTEFNAKAFPCTNYIWFQKHLLHVCCNAATLNPFFWVFLIWNESFWKTPWSAHTTAQTIATLIDDESCVYVGVFDVNRWMKNPWIKRTIKTEWLEFIWLHIENH